MTVVHVPRPDPKRAMNPNRPANTLLKAQIEHLQEAEWKLPIEHQSNIYVNAIQTEGEAAEYIKKVTESIQAAHQAVAAKRAKRAPKRKRGIAIAAAADRPRRKRSSGAKAKKKSTAKRGRKK
jgi:hypothetical protein